MYKSTKTYGHERGLSCCFRQWRASSHCALLHGYALAISFEWGAEILDARNWVVDFGGLGDVKSFLESLLDHTLLVAEDDPELDELSALDSLGLVSVRVLPAVGCEALAQYIHAQVSDMTNTNRVKLLKVEVREHGANSAIYEVPYV